MPPRAGSHLGRLALTFAASFLATSAIVLGAWALLVHDRSSPTGPAIDVLEGVGVAPSLSSLSGLYTGEGNTGEGNTGEGNTGPMTLDLHLLLDGVLEATVERTDDRSTVTVSAEGRYALVGPIATVVLIERGEGGRLVYSGTIDQGVIAGRLTDAGREIGRFRVQK